MAKKTSRKQRKTKKQASLSSSSLIRQGTTTFKQSNYAEAIIFLEKAYHQNKDKDTLLPAIAESYFRMAINEPVHNIANLKQAISLMPNDQLYRYHLALAHHRQGQLEQAEVGYRQLLAESPPFKRAAVPLAQLVIIDEYKKPLKEDQLWNQLDEKNKIELAIAESLIKNKTILHNIIANNQFYSFWCGLAALSLDDMIAEQNLRKAGEELNQSHHHIPFAIAKYYLGLLTANSEQPAQTLKDWQVALDNGFDTPHLRKNLFSLAYQQLLLAQKAGHPDKALKLLAQLYDLEPENNKLPYLHKQLNLEQGYAASQKGDWGQALHNWQAAKVAGDDSRNLLLNLALAYQNQGQYQNAAEYWRQLIYRRPHKDTHPEAITDHQAAIIWENVAENYGKVGDYEEAIKTYKNAVKWNPDNVELRLKLVDVLQNEGRWQAAENELNRVLKKKPDYIPALIMLGENYADDYLTEKAEEVWIRILELEPQNPVAIQQLAYLYRKKAISIVSLGGSWAKALNVLEKGLEYIPNNQAMLTLLGTFYLERDDYDQAYQYFDQAIEINPENLQTLYSICNGLLLYGNEKKIDEHIERIKSIKTTSIPGRFFLDLVEICKERYPERVEQLLEHIKKHYSNDIRTLMSLGEYYYDHDYLNEAAHIFRNLLSKNSTNAKANFILGKTYYEMGQTRLGKRHWHKAERLAKQENNYRFLLEIRAMKNFYMHGNSSNSNRMIDLMRNLSPELLDDIPPEIRKLLENSNDMEDIF